MWYLCFAAKTPIERPDSVAREAAAACGRAAPPGILISAVDTNRGCGALQDRYPPLSSADDSGHEWCLGAACWS